LGIGIQCRVTAGENEAEAVVYHVVVLDLGTLLRDIEFTGDFAPALAQRSIARNRPVEISQDRGLAGTPSIGQRSTAAANAS